MIIIVKGSYGLKVGGVITPITEADGPISLDPKREKELVEEGVAVYAEDPVKDPAEEVVEEAVDEGGNDFPEYSADMKLAELKEIAEKYGVDVAGMKSKKEVIAAIEEARSDLQGFDASSSVR